MAGLQQPRERSVPTILGNLLQVRVILQRLQCLPWLWIYLCFQGLRAERGLGPGGTRTERKDPAVLIMIQEGKRRRLRLPSQEPCTWCSGGPCWPLGACVTLWGGAARPRAAAGTHRDTPVHDMHPHRNTHSIPPSKHVHRQSHVCLDADLRSSVQAEREHNARAP